MALYDEEERKKEKKHSEKMRKLIIFAIVLSVLIIIVLICGIYYLISNPSEITINVDGTSTAELIDIINITTDEDGNIKITAPIKDIAPYLGYKAFNGGYTTVSEDTDSCYVENDNEIAIFNLDSNIIYKLDQTVSGSEYEYCQLENDIYMENNKLYTDEEGLEKAFNIYIYYDVETKTLDIYTLTTFVTSAQSRVTKYGYESLDDTFANQKAILEDMMVVISEDGLYGVVNYSTGEEILGAQYDLVTYIPQKSAFLIEKNSKVGIIASNGVTKISPMYDELLLIDDESELYLAKMNNLYGVVNIEGKTVIYLEYDQIGIDIEDFEQSNIKTGYILLNKLIPVMQNKKWGFFDKEGNQVTDLIYDAVGSDTTNSKSLAYNLLLIADENVVVVKRDDCYTFINLDGKELLSCVFEDVYMEISSGKEEYYMVWEDTVYDVLEYIQ